MFLYFLSNLRKAARFELLIIIIAVLSILSFPLSSDSVVELVKPQTVYDYRLRMEHADVAKDVSISVYLPQENQHQTIISQSYQAPKMTHQRLHTAEGTIGNWRGNGEATTIDYRALIQPKAYRFLVDEQMPFEPQKIDQWPETLSSTLNIQSEHQEIEQLWQQIKPQDNSHFLPIIRAIYDHVYQLETLPFKSTTDALTALRLGAASCNGKSRLFVALARHIGIPARLIGGVILEPGRKKTSHQWLELNINNQWIAFDPTNGYFAELPAHYLELYRGDKALFKRSSDIDFDYYFDISAKSVAPVLYQEDQSELRETSLNKVLDWLAIPAQSIAIFLTLPICALIIVICRNLIGLDSFGVFLPLLISAACVVIGVVPGLIGVALISVIGLVAHQAMNKLNILKVPRLAAVITIVNFATLGLLFAFKQISSIHVGVMSLFPVIILSFMADRLSNLVEEAEWTGILKASIGTIAMVLLCSAVMNSASVIGTLLIYPELYLLIIAAQIYIGRWRGLRVNELFRFRKLLQKDTNILGINQRNLDFVYGLNNPQALSTAVDKLATKSLLEKNGIPVPNTISSYKQFNELANLNQDIAQRQQFVLKPNSGSQGNGILVITRREGDRFFSASGKAFGLDQITTQANEIISGHYSQNGQADTAYIEPLINQHQLLKRIAGNSLCDIRVVMIKGKIVNAMLRIPTSQSDGKANLHQGALGAALDLKTGKVTKCLMKGKEIKIHPDSQQVIKGITLPYWSQILTISEQCARAIELGYLGIDICLDQQHGPLVLELNGRPGLEIQNITQQSLLNARDSSYSLS